MNLAKSQGERPLAERLRPSALSDFAGLETIDASLIEQIRSGKGRIPSLVLWGPPGSGKTTFAKIVGNSFECDFVEISAVLSGVKDVRDVVARAKESTKPTLLFVDEIHRFNKGQQDAFLPHVESGVISLVGATTENPSFYLTSALLSRCKIVVLKGHSESALTKVLKRASKETGLSFDSDGEALLIQYAQGDARRLLNLVESIEVSFGSGKSIFHDELKKFIKSAKVQVYDRDGEEHYNIASAFIKSLRGSNPTAALYWGFRMLAGGEDPRFLIRRMVIFASEDIGNADPRALQIAVSTLEAFNLVGLPEGRIPIAQCITYLATAPKSNRSYLAMHKAIAAVEAYPDAPVPKHLRNAPTKLMSSLGYGDGYQYPHNSEDAFVKNVNYLGEGVPREEWYQPSDRGYEKTICERLEWLKNKAS